jgi:hypothetical protein
VVGEHIERDILRHARREVCIDEAHQRHIGHGRICQQTVDAGSHRDDELQAGQRAQQSGGRLPHQRGIDVLAPADLRRDTDVELAVERADLLRELLCARAAGYE